MNNRYFQNFNQGPSTSHYNQRYHPYLDQNRIYDFGHQQDGRRYHRNEHREFKDWRENGGRITSGKRISNLTERDRPNKRILFNDDNVPERYIDNRFEKSNESINEWALHFNDKNSNYSNKWPERPFSNYKLTEDNLVNESVNVCDNVNKNKSPEANKTALPDEKDIITIEDDDNKIDSKDKTANTAVVTDDLIPIDIDENLFNDGDEDVDTANNINDKSGELSEAKQKKNNDWKMKSNEIDVITVSIRKKFGKIKQSQLIWSKLFDGTYPFKVEVTDLPLDINEKNIKEHFSTVSIKDVEIIKSPHTSKKQIAFIYLYTNEDFKKCFHYHSTFIISSSLKYYPIRVYFPIHDEEYVGYEKLKRNIILEKIRMIGKQVTNKAKLQFRRMKRKARKIRMNQNILAFGQ